MSDLSEGVGRVLHQEKVTRYALAKRLKGQVPQTTVYAFLNGEDVYLSTAQKIFAAVGMKMSASGGGLGLLDLKKRWADEARQKKAEENRVAAAWNHHRKAMAEIEVMLGKALPRLKAETEKRSAETQPDCK